MKRQKGRNLIAVDAHFRKAGPHKVKKKQTPRLRKYKKIIEQNNEY